VSEDMQVSGEKIAIEFGSCAGGCDGSFSVASAVSGEKLADFSLSGCFSRPQAVV